MRDFGTSFGFSQMFGPSRSPFYAMMIGSSLCLTLISNLYVSAYGASIALIVATIAVVGSFFLPLKAPVEQVNMSLIVARSIGIIGALSALTLLLLKTSLATAENGRLMPGSEVFVILWAHIGITILFMLCLFFVRARPPASLGGAAMFNMPQFSLVHCSMLVCCIEIASAQNVFKFSSGSAVQSYMASLVDGAVAVSLAFGRLGFPAQGSRDHIVSALLFLMLLHSVLMLFRVSFSVNLGISKALPFSEDQGSVGGKSEAS